MPVSCPGPSTHTLAFVRSARDFFKPLAVGAPTPWREIPFRPSRVIHFFPAHNQKMAAKAPETAATVDILLANLEDGVPMAERRPKLAEALKELYP